MTYAFYTRILTLGVLSFAVGLPRKH
eukprot:SAG11_NODE_30385_length_301_cov_1.272277_1_plen_25_part_10